MGGYEIRNGQGVLIARLRYKFKRDEFKSDFYTPPDNVFVGRSAPFYYRDELDAVGRDVIVRFMTSVCD